MLLGSLGVILGITLISSARPSGRSTRCASFPVHAPWSSETASESGFLGARWSAAILSFLQKETGFPPMVLSFRASISTSTVSPDRRGRSGKQSRRCGQSYRRNDRRTGNGTVKVTASVPRLRLATSAVSSGQLDRANAARAGDAPPLAHHRDRSDDPLPRCWRLLQLSTLLRKESWLG